jgi:hypothetical protein
MAGSSSNAQALQVTLAHLAGALTYTELSNVDTNKKLWNEYARNYTAPAAPAPADAAVAAASRDSSSSSSSAGGVGDTAASWVLAMASQVSRGARELDCLGDEWSDPFSLQQSLAHFLFPYLGVDTLSEGEWDESAQVEARIAAGEKGLINHLPPTSLRKWIAASSEAAATSQATATAAAATAADLSASPAAVALPSRASSPAPGSLVVAEIGVGGGRVASRVYAHVKQLHCFDIADAMLQQAQQALARKYAMDEANKAASTAAASVAPSAAAPVQSAAVSADGDASSSAVATGAVSAPSSSAQTGSSSGSLLLSPPPNMSFTLLTSSPRMPPRYHGQCDFIYCFDVLPHVDLHTLSGYFRSLRALLRPNPSAEEKATGLVAHQPRVFLHTANLLAPLGWARFNKQSKGTAGGFFFHSPDIIAHLARQHGYNIVQQSRWTEEKEEPAGSDAPAAAPPSEAAAPNTNLYYQRDLLFVLEPI